MKNRYKILLLTKLILPATGPRNPRYKDRHLLLSSLLRQLRDLQAKSHCQGKAQSPSDQREWAERDQREWAERAWQRQEKELGAKAWPPSERAEVKTSLSPLPPDRCGPPESVAGQAKAPQEAGEGENSAHTTEEVSVHENQGELRLGTTHTLSLALSDLASWCPPPSTLGGKDSEPLWPLLGDIVWWASSPWMRSRQLPG